MKPEQKLWHEIKLYNKKNNCNLSFTRLENLSNLGTPDLLVYSPSGNFKTLELKYTKHNKVRFSPHQISFHIKHPKNSFILVKGGNPLTYKLYEGRFIKELVTYGLSLDACASDLGACCLRLSA